MRDGWTALMSAAAKGSLESAKLLIAHGADVNARDVAQATPLMYAAVRNSRKVIELLIENGADINARDNDGTAVLIIAKLLQPELVALFKERGAR